MEHLVNGAQAPADHVQPSASQLVKRLSGQVSVLVRDELKLAQSEVSRKGKRAGVGAGMLSGSGLIAFYGVGCLLACAPGPAAERQALQEEVERTREHLGETVEALAAKVNVKARGASLLAWLLIKRWRGRQ